MHIVNLFDGFLNRQGQIVHVDRFRDKVEGTIVHRLTDVRHIAIGTHHNDTYGGVVHLVHFGQERQTVHLGHIDVAEDDLNVGRISQDSKGLQTVVGKEELILSTTDLPPEMMFHHQLNRRLIINTQNPYSCHNSFSPYSYSSESFSSKFI